MHWLAKLAIGVGIAEGLGALSRHAERTRLFELANARAQQLHRPLLVIGDPDAGAHTALYRAYGCGDVCVDLTGCPKCPLGVEAIEGDLVAGVPLPGGEYVVFSSCVLEYVDDVEAAWAEHVRLAGGEENVFVATVQPWTITSYLFPGNKWVIKSAPPVGPFVAERRDGLLGGNGQWLGS